MVQVSRLEPFFRAGYILGMFHLEEQPDDHFDGMVRLVNELSLETK